MGVIILHAQRVRALTQLVMVVAHGGMVPRCVLRSIQRSGLKYGHSHYLDLHFTSEQAEMNDRSDRKGEKVARARARARARVGLTVDGADYAFVHFPCMRGVIQFLRQPPLAGPIIRRAIN